MTALGDTVNVYAQIEDSQPIYAGQRFKLYVVIDGDNTPGTVDQRPLADFDPQGPQVQDVSRSMTTIVNGRTTKEVTKRYLISYDLAVASPGQYVIPALDVNVGSRKYTTLPVKVNVLAPESTDRIAIEAKLSDTRCYAGQPVLLTVKWYVWQAVAGRVGDYMFNVPVFANSDFIIEDVSDNQAVANQGNIKINGLDVIVNQKTAKYDGNDCVEVSFNKVLIPQKSGLLDLGKISILCKINVNQSRFSFNSEFKSYSADAQPLSLEVLPLPQDGRPGDFYGLIGNYDIKAEAMPVDVKVGDPISLKISIGGSRYLKPVQWPDLEGIKELSDNFILPDEKGSPEIVDGRKVFTQTIRAKNDKVTRVPPIPLSCFDAKSGRYLTVSSAPIELKVSPTKMLTLSDVESGTAVESGRKLEAVKGGISANYAGSELLVNMAFEPQKRLLMLPDMLMWLLPAVIFVLSVIVKAVTRDKEAKAARRIKNNAAKNALSILKKCAGADDNSAKAMMDEAIRTYFARRFDRSSGSVTAHDCERIIVQTTGDEQLAGTLSGILEKCEASQYSPLAVKFESKWIEEAAAVIERVEKCVR